MTDVSASATPLEGVRITTVLNWAALGGAERRALALARWLRDEQGARVEFLALTDRDGRAAETARALGIPWRTVVVDWDGGKKGKAADYARFVLALRKGRPDVVMSVCSLPNVLCGLSWRAAGAATSLWCQVDVSPFRRAREATRRRAVGRTPFLVSNAEHGVEHLVQEWGASRDRIRVIRTGVEVGSREPGRVESRSALHIAQDDFVACMVAHFRRSKDHATLLRAWRTVVDELAHDGRRAVLLLAGDPYPMQDAAKALAFDLRLDDSVRFLGEVGDVAELVDASDVSVLSTLREGLPTSLLEGMAAGIAVAGTDVAGVREVVGDVGAPFLAPPGDDVRLADVLLRLARDERLRTELGAAGRERVRHEFTVESMYASYCYLLGEALASSGRLRPRFRGRR